MTATTTIIKLPDGTQRPLAPHWRALLDVDVAIIMTDTPDAECALACWKVLDACDRFEQTIVEVLKTDTSLTPARLLAVQQCALHYFG